MKSTEKDLQSLIERAQAGDEYAFGEIFDLFYARIYGYSLRRVLDVAVAQDIASNTFFKAYRSLNKFEWRHEASLSAWMYRIACNEVVSYMRKQSKYKLEDPEMMSQYETPEDLRANYEKELDSKAQYVVLHKAISKLKERDQNIIHLFYFEHMSHDDIAEIVQMKAGAVRVSLHRAIKRLQDLLEADPSFSNYFQAKGAQ